MSKEAKEYVESRYDTNFTINIGASDLADELESYHQHRVDSVSDEDIEKESLKQHVKSIRECYDFDPFSFVEGADWLKEKLINKQ